MSFIWPSMLLLLVLIPLGLAAVPGCSGGAGACGGYGRLRAGAAGDAAGSPGARRHIPPALFLLGLTILMSRWRGRRRWSACRASRAR